MLESVDWRNRIPGHLRRSKKRVIYFTEKNIYKYDFSASVTKKFQSPITGTYIDQRVWLPQESGKSKEGGTIHVILDGKNTTANIWRGGGEDMITPMNLSREERDESRLNPADLMTDETKQAVKDYLVALSEQLFADIKSADRPADNRYDFGPGDYRSIPESKKRASEALTACKFDGAKETNSKISESLVAATRYRSVNGIPDTGGGKKNSGTGSHSSGKID